jgi:hypothetical protein
LRIAHLVDPQSAALTESVGRRPDRLVTIGTAGCRRSAGLSQFQVPDLPDPPDPAARPAQPTTRHAITNRIDNRQSPIAQSNQSTIRNPQ